MLSLPVIIWEDSRTNWLSVSEVNNSTIKRMYQFLGQTNAQNVCVSERYECCPPRCDICQTRHTINTSGKHLLTTRIVVMTQRERHFHTQTHIYFGIHTHKHPVGCVIFQSCLSAVFWSLQCFLMITLSQLLFSAFSQSSCICLFIYPSQTPQLYVSLRINFL